MCYYKNVDKVHKERLVVNESTKQIVKNAFLPQEKRQRMITHVRNYYQTRLFLHGL